MNRCIVCQILFLTKRAHARYCGAKCRKTASRTGVKGAGADYDIVRRATMELSANKQRALIVYILGGLDDGQRLKLYDAIGDDMNRVKSVTISSHFHETEG